MQVLSVDHHLQGSMHSSNIAPADDDPLKSLSLDYLNLFSHGCTAFSDVIFCVEGKQVHAHRCILAARSAFFRMVFCKGIDPAAAANGSLASEFGSTDAGHLPLQIPVGVVSYDVLLIVLQFLYSGQLILAFQQGRSKCVERGCWHVHCSSHVDLALDTLQAATFFQVDQLSIMIQRHLGSIVEKVSIDDVMRVLVTSKKQGLSTLWTTCSELVARCGLAMETLRKHLPQEIASEIEEMRIQRGYGRRINNMMHYNAQGCSSPLSSAERGMISPAPITRIHKMRQALDSLDVELVRLMVMGEGLDLDGAHALHYSVSNCSRDVVKALLEMGAVNVNHPDHAGRTALHVACEMASPEMISVLLDHHASPLLQADIGDTPVDIIQGLMVALQSSSPASQQNDQNKLRLCLELLQSAAYVADKEDDFSDGVVTEPSSDNTSCRSSLYLHHNRHSCIDIPDCSSSFESLDACNAAIGTPRSLHQDWPSIESCSFEQDLLTPNLESKDHHQQPIHDHNASFINLSPRAGMPLSEYRAGSMRDMSNIDQTGFIDAINNDNVRAHAQMPSSAALSCNISTNRSGHGDLIASSVDGYLYPDFRMVHAQAMSASETAGVPRNHNTTTIF